MGLSFHSHRPLAEGRQTQDVPLCRFESVLVRSRVFSSATLATNDWRSLIHPCKCLSHGLYTTEKVRLRYDTCSSSSNSHGHINIGPPVDWCCQFFNSCSAQCDFSMFTSNKVIELNGVLLIDNVVAEIVVALVAYF